MKGAPIPDWHDGAQYPNPKTTSINRFAWEFLRRNTEFIAEWETAYKQQIDARDAGTLPAFTNERPLGVFFKKWGLDWKSAGLWGIDCDAPLTINKAPRFLHSQDLGDKRIHWAEYNAGRMALEFDLDLPIAPQIDEARRTLVANQKLRFPNFKRGRNQAEKLALYLRALDACTAGATPGEIIEVLALEHQDLDDRTLRNWIGQAKALRDGGWRDLLLQ